MGTRCVRAAGLSIVMLGAVVWTATATAQVYKCTQEGGRVLYSDAPCKGGTVVDVDAGVANPAAMRQLARDNAAFDRKMATRQAAEDQAEFQRQQLNAQLEAAQAAQHMAGVAPDAAAYFYYDSAYGYVAPPRFKRRTRPHSVSPRAAEHRVPAKLASSSGVRRRNP